MGSGLGALGSGVPEELGHLLGSELGEVPGDQAGYVRECQLNELENPRDPLGNDGRLPDRRPVESPLGPRHPRPGDRPRD